MTSGIAATKILSPVDEINRELIGLGKSSKEEVEHKGKPLFERLIQWMSKVDPKEEKDKYGLSTILIFAIASKLFEKEAIDKNEKAEMFNRAIEVISKNSDVIPTLPGFLEQRRQELLAL